MDASATLNFLGSVDERLSKLHADFEPDVVAFECLLRVDLRQPFQFGRETGFAELCGVREHRSDAGGHFLEAPQPRAVAAVAGGLRQVETIRADTDEAFAQRQMLCHGGVNVKHLPAMVVRFGVLGVDVVAEVGLNSKPFFWPR